MKAKRLKELAGITENVDIKAAVTAFDKISDLLVTVQDEIYSMGPEDRNQALKLVDDASTNLGQVKRLIANYM